MRLRDLAHTSRRAISRALANGWRWWAAAGTALVWLGPGCLNPASDDQPTFNENTPGRGTAVDIGAGEETCADNPLLAGCPRSNDGNPTVPVNPGSGAGAGGGAGSGGSGGMAGNGGLAGSAGAAGMPASELDAGAPDAGPIGSGPGDADAP